MKPLFAVLFLLGIMFNACKNDGKISHTEKNDDGYTNTTSVDVNGLQNSSEEMTKKIDELKKLTPLTLDQLKALLPEELNGMKRTSFTTNSAMGYAVAQAEYTKDDTTNLQLVIYDCAGEAGSGMYMATYWSQMNMQSESSEGYTKTIDFNGTKALENYSKSGNTNSLIYTGNERLLINLTGRNVGSDGVMQAAKSLNQKI